MPSALRWVRRLRLGLLMASLATGSAWALAETPTPEAVARAERGSMAIQAQIRVYFTPGNSAETAIAETIATAHRQIRVQAYSFTNPLIVQALADAQSRGVAVTVILDKSNRTQKYSAADFSHHSGIETLIDDRHAIAHNKIMIIDDSVVITGSYNFTRAAEKSNAENVVIIESGPIAQKYLQNWQKHRQHAEPYRARTSQ